MWRDGEVPGDGANRRCGAALDRHITETAHNWRFDRIAAIDKNILRVAAYELMLEPATPPAVVIDEAVELAKRFGEADSPAFVNGVLDAIKTRVRGEPSGAGAPSGTRPRRRRAAKASR